MTSPAAQLSTQLNNVRTAEHFGVAITIFIALFTIIHWVKVFVRSYGGYQKGAARTWVSAWWRHIRSITNRKVPGFNSAGHLTIYIIYIAINVTLTFANLDRSLVGNLAKRLGWISTSNLALTIFLSLKNTPLTFLTHYSHNALNILHRCAGYTVVVFAMLHAIVYIRSAITQDTLNELSEWVNVAGIVAGGFLLVIAATSFLLRRQNYELFYVSHVVIFILVMIMMGFHQPDISKRTAVVITFASSIWFLDRLIRATRMLYFSLGNFVTVIPLEDGGTRVVLNRVPRSGKPGMHASVWIPIVRRFETHPFTIVNTQDGGAEFVVAKQDGFTRDLYDFAVANPGSSIRAGIDGAYGTLPCFEQVDKVILITGGSGASFSTGVALELASKMHSRSLAIEYMWAFRDEAQLSWYSADLQDLRTAPNVKLRLYCTNSSSTPNSYSEKTNSSLSIRTPNPITPPSSELEFITTTLHDIMATPDIERQERRERQARLARASPISTAMPSPNSLHGLDINHGRPDLKTLINRSIADTEPGSRVLVCACGPTCMLDDVRDAVVGVLREDSIGDVDVEMHLESFGW